MHKLAIAGSPAKILEALQPHIADDIDRISLHQISRVPGGDASVETVAVWDRDKIALGAKFPEMLEQEIGVRTRVVSNTTDLDVSASALRAYTEDTILASSVAIFPLVRYGSTIGYVLLASRNPRELGEGETEILEELCVQVALTLENLALHTTLDRQMELLSLVNKLSQAIVGTLDFEALRPLIRDHLCEALTLSHLSIMWDGAADEGRRFELLHGDELAGDVGVEGTWIEQALLNTQTIHVADVAGWPDSDLWLTGDVRDLIVVPMIAQKRKIGTLNFGAGQEGSFGPEDLMFAEQAAVQVSAVLANVQLFKQLEHSLEETGTLYGATLAMNSAQSLTEVYDTALTEIANLSHPDRVTAYLAETSPEGQVEYVRAVATWEGNEVAAEGAPVRQPLADVPVLAQFPQSRANLIFNDLQADMRLSVGLRERYAEEGIASLALIPLSTGMTWLGGLLVESHRKQAFASEDIRLCRNLADQAALVIESHLLLRRAQDAAIREQALLDATSVMSSTLDLDELLERILPSIRPIIPYDAGNIQLIEENIARIVACQGYERLGLSSKEMMALRFPLEEFPNLQGMVESRQAVTIYDTQNHPGWVEVPETHQVRSYIGAPIFVEDRIIGFINLDSSTPGFFSSTQAEHLRAFADQVAIAIQNARLYRATRLQAEIMGGVTAHLQRSVSVDQVLETTVRTLRGSLNDYDITLRLAPGVLDAAGRSLPEAPGDGNGIYAQLREYIKDRGAKQGLSTLDLVRLPPSVRWIIRFMTRRREASYQTLREALEATSQQMPMSRDELDETLDALCRVGWLVPKRRGQTILYKTNFEAQGGAAPSAKAEAYRESVDASIYNLLDALDSEGAPSAPDDESDGGEDENEP